MKQKNKNTTIGIIASITLTIALFMTIVSAWSDINQTKRNVLQAKYDKHVVVELVKYELDTEGKETSIPIKDTQFRLYEVGVGGEADIDLGLYSTNAEGKITIPELLIKQYYFVEEKPAYGYTYQKDSQGNEIKRYDVRIPDSTADQAIIQVKAYNHKLVSKLEVKKQIVSSEVLSDVQKSEDFNFHITFSDNKEYTYTKQLVDGSVVENQTLINGSFTLKHNETVYFNDVPVGVYYEVKEQAKAGYAIDVDQTSGNIMESGSVVVFSNTVDQTIVDKGVLLVEKQIINDDGSEISDIQKKQIFEFELYLNDVRIVDAEYEINGVVYKMQDTAQVIQLKHGEIAKLKDIDKDTKYKVIERAVSDYTAQTKSYEGKIGLSETKVDFVNIYHLDVNHTGTIQVKKLVSGKLDESVKDKVFTFKIIFDQEVNNLEYVNVNTQEKGSIDGVKEYTFTLKKDEVIEFLNVAYGTHYVVEEQEESDYTATVRNVDKTVVSASVLNVFHNIHVVKSKLQVKKIMSSEYPDQDINKEFTFHVYLNDVLHTTLKLKPNEVSAPIEVAYGTNYRVVEVNPSSDGYRAESLSRGQGTLRGDDVVVVQSNSYVADKEVTIRGEKHWVNTEGISLPESITVHVKDKVTGKLLASKVVSGDVTSSTWNYEITFLATPSNEYTVEETVISGYKVSYDGYTITNTYIKPVQVETPKIIKELKGDTPPTKETFTFTMEAKDNAPMPAGSTNGVRSVSVSGSGETNELGKIEYTKPGTYVYEIKEQVDHAEGYVYDQHIYNFIVTVDEQSGILHVTSKIEKVDSEEVMENTITFINEYYKHPYVKNDLTVKKVWEGTNKSQPTSINVQLYRDDKAEGEEVTLSAANNWQHTWRYLDPKAKWTVDEVSVPSGYTKVVKQTAEHEITIVNTFKTSPAPKPNIDPNKKKTDPSNGGADTSDRSNVLLWALLLLASAVVLYHYPIEINRSRYRKKYR